MNYQDVVSNVKIYGFEDAVKGAKYSYATDINKVNGEVTKTTESLAGSPAGSGHDQFMTGIVVQFDLTFSNKAWVEAERYKFLNFVSSQSTMHRITKFNLDEVYMEYTDPRIIAIMKEKVAEYNVLMNRIAEEKEKGNDMVVVVSAMGKTTDHLVEMSKEIAINPNKREMDLILSTFSSKFHG